MLPTTTTPARLFALDPLVTESVASLKVLVNSELTVEPGLTTVASLTEMAWSSLIAASVTVDVVIVGASFTGVTLVVMVSVPADQPVVVPLPETSL